MIHFQRTTGEEGSVLVVALIMLVFLTLIGIAASRNTEVELQIAGNQKFHQMAFYAADAGPQAGIEILEVNIEERGFSGPYGGGSAPQGSGTLNFFANVDSGNTTPAVNNFDINLNDVGSCEVYMRVYGDTGLSTGSALQLASGYEGKGKALGAGGAFIVYDIRSLAEGPVNSEARVCLKWRHMI